MDLFCQTSKFEQDSKTDPLAKVLPIPKLGVMKECFPVASDWNLRWVFAFLCRMGHGLFLGSSECILINLLLCCFFVEEGHWQCPCVISSPHTHCYLWNNMENCWFCALYLCVRAECDKFGEFLDKWLPPNTGTELNGPGKTPSSPVFLWTLNISLEKLQMKWFVSSWWKCFDLDLLNFK